MTLWRTLIGLVALVIATSGTPIHELKGQGPRAFPDSLPQDARLGPLKTLNGYFPFHPVASKRQWEARREAIRRRILVSQGLWPMPAKTPLRAVIHGRVERDDYVVDRVFFESIPGHFVTGSLYRPRSAIGASSKEDLPAILSPHGHWQNGRFYDAGDQEIERQLAIGAEAFPVSGRFPIQARAVQLARMGAVVFVYDMTGYADSIQIPHRPEEWSHLDRPTDWGFMSRQAVLRLQNMMGLQTWNSIRAVDFVRELEGVDPDRIGVTGASGGGTQTMILSAVDARIAAAMPCVMVSTAMQGGCSCENASYLRIDQGNIDIAAATAPRPLGLTAADDWTVELESKGYPDLQRLYAMLGRPEHLTAAFLTQFKHNYNAVSRHAMYEFFNRHFQMGHASPIRERDFVPLTKDEATVWTNEYPAPSGDEVGDAHQIRLLRMVTRYQQQQFQQIVPTTGEPDQIQRYRDVVGKAWQTMLGRTLDQVQHVSFHETMRQEAHGNVIHAGHVDHVDHGEQLPTVWVQSSAHAVDAIPDQSNDSTNRTDSRGTVIWITDQGKGDLFEGPNKLRPAAQRIVDAGLRLVAADLLGQGEFTADGQSWTTQPMWFQGNGKQGWQRYSGYTYGYNHPLFCKRVHDVLTLIRFSIASESGPVCLVGDGAQAGPIAIAAAAQSDGVIGHMMIDPNGFRFADVPAQNHPMFVPGAVKYLDLDGLMSLCAPLSIDLIGDEASFPISRSVYRASDNEDRCKFMPTNELVQLIDRWLASEKVTIESD